MGIFSFICYSVYFRNINSLNCISLSLIPKHSFFHAIVNEIFPLISFFSLPIADIENPTDFCFTAWYPAALLKSANQTSQVSVESLVFSTYNIMSPANRAVYFFLSNLDTFYFFVICGCLTRTFCAMRRNGGQPYLLPVRGTFRSSQLNTASIVGFLLQGFLLCLSIFLLFLAVKSFIMIEY